MTDNSSCSWMCSGGTCAPRLVSYVLLALYVSSVGADVQKRRCRFYTLLLALYICSVGADFDKRSCRFYTRFLALYISSICADFHKEVQILYFSPCTIYSSVGADFRKRSQLCDSIYFFP